MNFNAIISVLIIKGILTREEADALVNHLNDRPQSTVLEDVFQQVSEIIGVPNAAILPGLGPVGPEQRAEELAARNSVATPSPAPAATPNEPDNTYGPADEQTAPADTSDAPSEPAKTEEPAKPADTETDKTTKDTPVKKSADKTSKK